MPTNLETVPDEIAIADAVVDLLNDGEFSALFTAARFDSAKVALEKLPTAPALRVAVINQDTRRKQLTRGGAKTIEFDISVGVMRRVDRQKTNRLDDTDLVRLIAAELVTYLENTPLDLVGVNVRQTDSEIHTTTSPEHLDQLNTALAIKTITYKTYVG